MIPAGEVEVIDCIVEPQVPGPFGAQLHLYVADDGLREIVLIVRGEARSPGIDPK